MLTWTTLTRLSGYFSKTAEKASTGKQSTVESSAARAETVRYGRWWPCQGQHSKRHHKVHVNNQNPQVFSCKDSKNYNELLHARKKNCNEWNAMA